jgi:hypothetical protein
VAQNLLKDGEGRFFRGNLHCHSNRSNGLVEPEAVVGVYCGAGYFSNMICLGQTPPLKQVEWMWEAAGSHE